MPLVEKDSTDQPGPDFSKMHQKVPECIHISGHFKGILREYETILREISLLRQERKCGKKRASM